MIERYPSIFIGSSTEGLDVAREVELQLQGDAITTIWKDGVFGLGSGTLESLMSILDQFDFAAMVLSPDDLIESRSQSYASPRDNVIFELGLFMGKLGRGRVFIVHEQGRQQLATALDPCGTRLAVSQARNKLQTRPLRNWHAIHKGDRVAFRGIGLSNTSDNFKIVKTQRNLNSGPYRSS